HADHGTLKSYATGFLLAVLLTAIPFWLVIGKVFDKSSTTALVILAFAAVQIVVHMIYFLHMNAKAEGGWSMLALLFTVMLVVIMLAGSIWVMFHLNHNMMPGMQDMRNMP
ncbi:MAG TPA: cytochrome o ubiquinol oxidase subunit IV, partial [Janthinobacterium sp.]|nr:cytochrome o ubiquinol oxidase subunit IV [Janthinobacterium sp.]